VLRNAAFANRALWGRGSRAAAAGAFRGRFAAVAGPRSGHRWWRHGRVIGWIGPLFWPYASYDVIYYTFYPYYEDTFWPYAYDDVYEGIFGSYAYAEPYGGGPRRSRARTASARSTAGSPGATPQLCTQPTSGLTDLPIERIAQTVGPTDAQKALLDKLKNATAKAVDILQDACPTELPSTPTGRMDALEKRLDAMVAAVDTVRQPLQEFYNSLSDEQKARFNAVEQNPDADNARVAREEQSELTRTCNAGAGITDVPIQRIAQAVRPTGAQRDALDDLKDAMAQAASGLKTNCPNYTALTPVGRVELMEQRLKTLRQAVKTVHPALAKFYQSLSDEQKQRFNTLGTQQS
jgi:ABC-type transporter MlaC component